MTALVSPATGRRYPLTLIGQVFRISRSSGYARAATAGTGEPAGQARAEDPLGRRGRRRGDPGGARRERVPWGGLPEDPRSPGPLTVWPLPRRAQ
jgi:hypothetical protein